MKLTLLTLLLLAPAARPDTIYLTDGTTIEGAKIVEETLKGVSYRLEGKSGDKTVDPDSVLRIAYARLPKEIDEAEEAYKGGEVVSAGDALEVYVREVLDGEKRERVSWAPAYAMHRLIEIYLSAGNAKGVVASADKLIKNAPQSRHVPTAYLAKAQAQHQLGAPDEALRTLEEFGTKIDESGLSQRWKLERDLSSVLLDPKVQGSAKRDRLIELADSAGSNFPTVRNRARVAEGESYLEGNTKDFASARRVFEAITANPKADPATLAGAHTGLGDCQFQEAVDLQKEGKDPAANLGSALDNYLRVTVLYKEQERYAAKASYFAGRVFEFMDQENSRERARAMYVNTVQRYRGSEWADKARTALGG